MSEERKEIDAAVAEWATTDEERRQIQELLWDKPMRLCTNGELTMIGAFMVWYFRGSRLRVSAIEGDVRRWNVEVSPLHDVVADGDA